MRNRGIFIWTVAGAAGLATVSIGGSAMAAPASMATASSSTVDRTFTYLGQLNVEDAPYSGVLDVRFVVWDAREGGTRVTPPVTVDGVRAIKGVFRAPVSLPDHVAKSDATYWLEVSVRAPAGRGAFVPMTPRRPMNSQGTINQSLTGLLSGGGSDADLFMLAQNRWFNASGSVFMNMDADNDDANTQAFHVQRNTQTDVGGQRLFTVLENGRVGVNAPAPIEEFQVADDFYVDSGVGFTGVNRNARRTSAEFFGVQTPTGNGAYGGMYMQTDGATGWPFYGYANSGGGSMWTYYDGATDIWHVFNGGANRLSVGPLGNVGVGVPSPIYHHQVVGDTSYQSWNEYTGTGAGGSGTGLLGYNSNSGNSGYAVWAFNNSPTGYDIFASGSGMNYFANEVGIGNTAPIYPLDIDSNSLRSIDIDNIFTPNPAAIFSVAHATGGAAIRGINDPGGWGAYFDGAGTRNYFEGIVGIGTTAPVYSLDATSDDFITVRGTNTGGAFGSYAGWFENSNATSTNTKIGALGYISSSTAGTASRGVWGFTSVGGGQAGYFSGNVTVTGSVSKGGGSFKIDHPVDPENKYLMHSFVESPDMMNVYNGNTVTDGDGFATVQMPDWFSALNRDFRYQLTVIGTFAQAIIGDELNSETNTFVIQTNRPNVKVSWQITGIRHDKWADANRIPTEVEKVGEEIGRFLHPTLFGAPRSEGIDLIGTDLFELTRQHQEREANQPVHVPPGGHYDANESARSRAATERAKSALPGDVQ